MKTKKIEDKNSIEYVIKDGFRVFRFVEYKEDIWEDGNKKNPKLIYKKGETDFFYLIQDPGFPLPFWSQIKNIKTLKRAKEYVRKREYL
tara:strand:+ start:68 stop:334 length:267 start_codon:yes stop_codon:yes gene_type:complete